MEMIIAGGRVFGNSFEVCGGHSRVGNEMKNSDERTEGMEGDKGKLGEMEVKMARF